LNYHNIEWIDPHFQPLWNEDIEDIVNQNIDVLCLSFFIWNVSSLNRLAKRAKEANPNIVIIAGGPQLDAHKRQGFFDDYPYIDYVVYGDGEEPFADILDALFEKRSIVSTSNLVTKDMTYPHKVFSDKGFWNTSYVLDMKEEIKADLERILKTCKGIKLDWEVDRGCPYACTFCDWSSGLHHKVKRRSKSWKEEIDFLKTLPVDVKLSNANFGIYEEDLRIAEYIRDNNIKNVKVLYLAKLNKDRSWKIQDVLAENDSNYVTSVSIQDVDEEILDNIDRPSVSWEEEKLYILEFYKKHPESMFYFIIMIGLPGQTVESFKYLIMEIDSLNIKMTTFGSHQWHLLNNSPAYDKDYQEKFKLTFEEFFIPTMNNSNDYNENLSLDDLNSLYESGSPFATKVKLIKETYSADMLEIIKMMTLMGITSGIKNMNTNIDLSKILLSPSLDRLLHKEAKSTMESIERNKLWGKWCQVEKKWFNIDSYYYRPVFINQFIEHMHK
jgi:tRNA A37 methylthiotransferase MiaB